MIEQEPMNNEQLLSSGELWAAPYLLQRERTYEGRSEMTEEEFPSNWLRFSSSGTFCLLVNPDLLPNDAVFIEELTALAVKSLHCFAAKNKAIKDAKSEETRKACVEFWTEEMCKG